MRSSSFGCLTLVALACACGGREKQGSAAEGGTDRPVVRVQTVRARLQPFERTVEAIGIVAGRSGSYAELGAPGPTRVARIYVAEGDIVKAGAPLVDFERAPFEAAAQSADAAVIAAERAHERTVRLARAGVVPDKEVDRTAADLAQTRTAAVTARRARELATARAPIDGVVTRMSAVLGAPVDVTPSVVAMADPTALDVLFRLAPADAARVAPEDSVALNSGQGFQGEPLGSGWVREVGAAVDSASGSVVVRVHVLRPARTLRIGETLFGRITLAVDPDVIVLPEAALVPDTSGFKVFVVDASEIAHGRRVEVGARGGKLVEIVGGLLPGERIAVGGAYGLQDGAKVVEAGQ